MTHRDRAHRHIHDSLLDPCALEGALHERMAALGEGAAQHDDTPAPRARDSARRILLALCLALVIVVTTFASCTARAADGRSCDWSEPGHDRYTGEVLAALAHYQDIPADSRARLAARMARREYDEIVTITAGAITGRHRYAPELWAMHYGEGRICMSVTRAGLKGEHYALAYTDGDATIVIPTDCTNVSRATRYDEPDVPPRLVESAHAEPIALAPVPAEPFEVAPLPEPFYADGGGVSFARTWMSASVPAVVLINRPPPGAIPAVPEPSTWWLLVAGVLAIWLKVRRSRDRGQE